MRQSCILLSWNLLGALKILGYTHPDGQNPSGSKWARGRAIQRQKEQLGVQKLSLGRAFNQPTSASVIRRGKKVDRKRGGAPHLQANGKKFCDPCIATSLGQHAVSLKQGQGTFIHRNVHPQTAILSKLCIIQKNNVTKNSSVMRRTSLNFNHLPTRPKVSTGWHIYIQMGNGLNSNLH